MPATLHIAHGEVFIDQCKNRATSDMGVKWAKWDEVGKEGWSGENGLD